MSASEFCSIAARIQPLLLLPVLLHQTPAALPPPTHCCLNQETVDAAHDLLRLLSTHLQLETLAADDRQLLRWRDDFVRLRTAALP
jgi:hypothetical protein